jgi:hypothetical protein
MPASKPCCLRTRLSSMSMAFTRPHMARTGKVWIKRGKKLHVLSNTGRAGINIHSALNLATGQFTFMNNLTIDALSTIQLFKNLEIAYQRQKQNSRLSRQCPLSLQQACARVAETRRKAHHPAFSASLLSASQPDRAAVARIAHAPDTQHIPQNLQNLHRSIMTFCRTTIQTDRHKIKSYVTDNFSLKSNENLKFI